MASLELDDTGLTIAVKTIYYAWCNYGDNCRAQQKRPCYYYQARAQSSDLSAIVPNKAMEWRAGEGERVKPSRETCENCECYRSGDK